MQETFQHEALAVNTRVDLSVEPRNKSVNGLHVKRTEILRRLCVQKESVVVKLSMLEVIEKLGPNHLSNHTTDQHSVTIKRKLSFTGCIPLA